MEAQGMVAQDGAFLKSQVEFSAIVARMQKAAGEGRTIGEVEKEVNGSLQRLGRLMLMDHVRAQGKGDLGPTIEHQGRTLRRLHKRRTRRLVTVFGALTIRRAVY